jgi:hypothetical protein
MSDECQKHPRSRPKHVSMNNWNYTKYIPVVPHYLANNYEQVYKDLCDIWSRLLVPSDFDRMKKESHQIGNVCRAICYEFAGPYCLASVLQYIS